MAEIALTGPTRGRLPGLVRSADRSATSIIVRRARALFERIVVAVLVNDEKTPLFTHDERVAIIREVFANMPNVEVDTFDGLLVDYAPRRGAIAIVRGVCAARPTSNTSCRWR